MAWWENSALNSVANMALLDGVLLLPQDEGRSVGGCLAMFSSSSRRGLIVAVNLSIGGGRVLSLLRVVGPVVCVSGSSSSSLLMCVSLSESEFSGS